MKRACKKCLLTPPECVCSPEDCELDFRCCLGKGHKGICDLTGFNGELWGAQYIEDQKRRHPEYRVFCNAVGSLLKDGEIGGSKSPE